MKKLTTAVLDQGKTTDILLADDLKDLANHLGGYGRAVMWVFDTNTAKLFKQLPPAHVVLESGESSKHLSSLERILSTCLDEGLARDGRIIGFGGGVVCDLSAFAASVYMRGCRLTLVPTTLLAMVDAAVGGKTAVDFRGMKNMVGSFYPAGEVLICIDTLRTLSDKEFLNGLAEVIKHALLSQDEELYKFLLVKKNEILSREPKTLATLVELSLEVKKWYIEQDPTETKGIRQMLNLGHTFAHALESSSHFPGITGRPLRGEPAGHWKPASPCRSPTRLMLSVRPSCSRAMATISNIESDAAIGLSSETICSRIRKKRTAKSCLSFWKDRERVCSVRLRCL